VAVHDPTPIFRFIHIDNLQGYLERGGLHAPNHCPDDGRLYRTIHNEEVQDKRHVTRIPCGPGGTIHDYVPFYFGYLSPMLLNLKTGRVPGYDSGAGFVFSNGHGLAMFTDWFDNLANLDKVIGLLCMNDTGRTHWRIWIGNGENRRNSLCTDSATGH
jgi:hypothetical protein